MYEDELLIIKPIGEFKLTVVLLMPILQDLGLLDYQDPICVLNYAGFVILISTVKICTRNCNFYYESKNYVALSISFREFLPIKHLVEESLLKKLQFSGQLYWKTIWEH